MCSPVGDSFRAVKSCKLAFVGQQIVGRRLHYARSDPSCGKNKERVFSAVALYVEKGLLAPFEAGRSGRTDHGFTASMAEGDAEGRPVFVQCGTLLEHLSRDNTGVFHFTATVSGYKLRLAVAEDDVRLPYGLDFGRIVQFIRCRFAGDEVDRELALLLRYERVGLCPNTFADIVRTPEPSPRTLILVDVTTIDHVAHLMPRWDHQTATEKGHNKDGTRLYGIVEKGVTTTSALPRPHAGPSTANLHGGGSEVDGEDARRKRARKEPESLGFNAPPEPLTPLTNVDTNQYLVDILLHGRH